MSKAKNKYIICSALLPLTRIWHIDLISQLLRRLSCKFYTDKLFEKQKYIIGNTCAKIFTDKKDAEGPKTGKPSQGSQGPGKRPRVAKCGSAHSQGMAADARMRFGARGSETNGGGWQDAGAGAVQAGGASHWERRRVSGEKLVVFDDEQLRMGRQ